MNKTQWVIVAVILITVFVGVKKLVESQGMVALFALIFIFLMITFILRLVNYARQEA